MIGSNIVCLRRGVFDETHVFPPEPFGKGSAAILPREQSTTGPHHHAVDEGRVLWRRRRRLPQLDEGQEVLPRLDDRR